MSILESSLSALNTKPASRCGRKPTVVRITRSHEASIRGRLTKRPVGVAPAGALTLAVRAGAHAPKPKPRAAILPVLSQLRLFIASFGENYIAHPVAEKERTQSARPERPRKHMWFRGVILKKANSPPRITARRGGGVTKKMARSLLIGAAGAVFLVRSIGTPPRPREKRMLRNIFFMARPPLLAV